MSSSSYLPLPRVCRRSRFPPHCSIRLYQSSSTNVLGVKATCVHPFRIHSLSSSSLSFYLRFVLIRVHRVVVHCANVVRKNDQQHTKKRAKRSTDVDWIRIIVRTSFCSSSIPFSSPISRCNKCTTVERDIRMIEVFDPGPRRGGDWGEVYKSREKYKPYLDIW